METHFPPAIGWNTWDVQYHTGWVHLPDGIRIRLVIVGDDDDDTVWDDVTWRRGMVAMGPHTIDGSYSQSSWERAGLTLSAAEAADGAQLSVAVTASGSGARPGVIVDASPAACFAEPVQIVDAADGFVVSHGDREWSLRFAGATTSRREGNLLLVEATGDFGFELTPSSDEPSPSLELLRTRIAEAAEVATDSEVATAGWLGEAGQAMSRAVTWNTIYVSGLRRVMTPTSRDFVIAEREGFYGTWAVHAWDTFFTALVASTMDQNYAAGIVDQLLSFATPAGMLPNRISDERGSTLDRSQPPVGGITVLQSYRASGLSDDTRGQAVLAAIFPALVSWHEWWLSSRVGPFGVLTWGSDPIEGDDESGTMDRARRESGLDDSPMYDDVTMNPVTHTIDLADVGLNALHIADARALAEIAEILGEGRLVERFDAEADAASRRFDEVFWSEEHGLYLNRWEGGAFSPSVSPTLLYPLLAGIPDPDRAREIGQRLLAPGLLGGDPPLPSVARNDPGFDSKYWRGRIWAPIVYLAVSGLRRYQLDDLATPAVDSLLTLFLHEWTEHSSVRENYPSAVGEDVMALTQRSDAFMAWGGLLGLLAIGELARPDATGWRFSHPGRDASVSGIQLAEGTLSVSAGERLVVALNDRTVVSAPFGATLDGFAFSAESFSAIVTLPGGGEIAVALPDGTTHLSVALADEQSTKEATGAEVRFDIAPGVATPLHITFERGER